MDLPLQVWICIYRFSTCVIFPIGCKYISDVRTHVLWDDSQTDGPKCSCTIYLKSQKTHDTLVFISVIFSHKESLAFFPPHFQTPSLVLNLKQYILLIWAGGSTIDTLQRVHKAWNNRLNTVLYFLFLVFKERGSHYVSQAQVQWLFIGMIMVHCSFKLLALSNLTTSACQVAGTIMRPWVGATAPGLCICFTFFFS